MPGLVAFIGGDREAVRRAVCAMRRREWHRVSLLEDRAAEATVGVVGEAGGVAADPRTGVLVAVDGEFLGPRGTISGDACAEQLLRRYLAQGRHVEPPDGCFAAAVWDPRAATLVLVTDLVGARTLHVVRRDGRLLAAGELKALLAAGVEARLDLQACAELLAYEFVLGERTLVEDVREVPAASSLALRRDGVALLHRRWRYRLEPAAADDGELVEELGRVVRRAVEDRLDDASAVALSGGLDSRTMVAAMHELQRTPIALTFGARGSEDLRLGEEVAGLAGLAHIALPLERGYIARGAAETVWLAEGNVRCFHAHQLALRAARAHGARSLLVGYAGDAIFRAYRGVPRAAAPLPDAYHPILAGCVSDELAEAVLTPMFLAALRDRAREGLADALAEEEGDRVAVVRQFVWNHVHRRKVLRGAALFADDVTPRDPLADARLIELCRRMPERLRLGGALERAYLAQFPALAAVRNPKDGLPPVLNGRRRVLALRARRARAQARNVVERRVGVARLRNARGIGDYAADLRQAGRPLLEILLEPRTLERGQLREEGVRRLVDDLLAGRRRNTRALGALLTVELFQRQFVDGDGDPAGYRRPGADATPAPRVCS